MLSPHLLGRVGQRQRDGERHLAPVDLGQLGLPLADVPEKGNFHSIYL